MVGLTGAAAGRAAAPVTAPPQESTRACAASSVSPVRPTGSFSDAWPRPSCIAAPTTPATFETPTVSLGHRRLSIIDREGGHQPIANEDETVWLVYNGEVYNYRELRAELEAAGHTFRTSCDSEVIVHAYEEWGPACAARFNGMWAFAVADLRARRRAGGKLVLNRDHFGIKPLFYARSPQSGRLLFASEIKALLQDPELAPSRTSRWSSSICSTASTTTAPRRSSAASTTCRRRPGSSCRWAAGARDGPRRPPAPGL